MSKQAQSYIFQADYNDQTFKTESCEDQEQRPNDDFIMNAAQMKKKSKQQEQKKQIQQRYSLNEESYKEQVSLRFSNARSLEQESKEEAKQQILKSQTKLQQQEKIINQEIPSKDVQDNEVSQTTQEQTQKQSYLTFTEQSKAQNKKFSKQQIQAKQGKQIYFTPQSQLGFNKYTEEEIETMSRENSEYKEKIAVKDIEISQLEEKLQNKQKELAALSNKKNTQLQQQIQDKKRITKQNQWLKDQTQQHLRQLEEYQKIYHDLESKLSQSQGKYKELLRTHQQEKKCLKTSLQSKSYDYCILSHSNEKLKTKVEKLKQLLQRVQQPFKQLKAAHQQSISTLISLFEQRFSQQTTIFKNQHEQEQIELKELSKKNGKELQQLQKTITAHKKASDSQITKANQIMQNMTLKVESKSRQKQDIENVLTQILKISSSQASSLRNIFYQLFENSQSRDIQMSKQITLLLDLVQSLNKILNEYQNKHLQFVIRATKEQCQLQCKARGLVAELEENQKIIAQLRSSKELLEKRIINYDLQMAKKISFIKDECLQRQNNVKVTIKNTYSELFHAQKQSFDTQKTYLQKEIKKLKEQLQMTKVISEMTIKELQQLLTLKQTQITDLQEVRTSDKKIWRENLERLKQGLAKVQSELNTKQERQLMLKDKIKQYDSSWYFLENTAVEIQMKDQKDHTIENILRIFKQKDKQNKFKALAATFELPLKRQKQLKVTLQKQTKTLDDKNSQIHRLRQERIESKARNQALTTQTQRLRKRIKKIEEAQLSKAEELSKIQLDQKNEEIQKLTNQMKQLRLKNNQLTKELKNRHSQLQKVNILKETNQRVNTQIQQIQLKFDTLQKQNQQLKEHNLNYERESNLFKDTIRAMKQGSDPKSNQNKQLKDARDIIQKLKQQKEGLDAQCLTLKNKIEQLKTENKALIQYQDDKEKIEQSYKKSKIFQALSKSKVQQQRETLDTPSSSQFTIPFFADSQILRQKNQSIAFLVNSIQGYINRTVEESVLRVKMQNKSIQQKQMLKCLDKQTIVWLFKKGDNIFGAVSFDSNTRKDLPVILFSLQKFKVVYPGQGHNKWTSIKSQTFYLSFGQNEAKFIWKSKVFVVSPEPKFKYFDSKIPLVSDLFGSERIQVDQFEGFVLKFVK